MVSTMDGGFSAVVHCWLGPTPRACMHELRKVRSMAAQRPGQKN